MSFSTCRVLAHVVVPLVLAAPTFAGDPCDPDRQVEYLPLPPITGEFGNALAVGPDLIAVGDPKAPPTGSVRGEGSVTIYRRGLSGWSCETVISPSSGRCEFGQTVSLSGDWLFVGTCGGFVTYRYAAASTGSPWIPADFRSSQESWRLISANQDQVLITEAGRWVLLERNPVDLTQWTSVSLSTHTVGYAKAFAGNLLMCTQDYSVRLFRRDGQEWLSDGEIAFPTESGPPMGRWPRVATDGTRIAIGYATRLPYAVFGWVDVYRKDSMETGWVLETRIHPPQDALFAASGFGFSVALAGDRLVVGSPDDNLNGGGTGAVFCYRFSDGLWRPTSSYHGHADEVDGQLGYCVAIQGDDAIATGSGYRVTINPVVIPFCADPEVNKVCTPGIVGLLNFVQMFLTGDPAADYNTDGTLSPDDLFRFLADWFAGCPH